MRAAPRSAAPPVVRRSAARDAVAEPQLSGVQLALDGSGRRSSVRAGKAIAAAALGALDEAAAQALLAERNWRRQYPRHWQALVRAQAAAPERVLASCQAGLQAAWSELRFARDGREDHLADAMQAPRAPALQTLRLKGEGPPGVHPWAVPHRGRWLAGEALAAQIARWETAGVCEPSHAQALREVLAHPEWFDLSDRHLVLLGAASEAGPLPWLARWRANLIAVDLPRTALWKRIGEQVRAGNATLTAPCAAGADDPLRAGADLLTQAPEIAAWLGDFGAPLDIACLAYADGERHLRVAAAMDAIAAQRCAADARTTLAFMATPTDVFAVPEPLALAVQARWDSRGRVKRMAQAGLRAGSGGRTFAPAIETLVDAGAAGRWGIVDALVVEQGPNYALAKRLQQWRAIVARAAGHRVSINVAPSTSTASVLHNPMLAAGFRGAKAFDCEVFEPATTNALMAALWVHDLRTRSAKADPAHALAHPLQLLSDGANHGGLWRMPYLPRSVLPMAALLGLVKRR